MIKCECSERIGSEINSYQLNEDVKTFFEEQVREGVFSEVPVEKTYCNGFEWKADKWYKCKSCGCLWEYKHPDFPAKGFVHKFVDGLYRQEEIGKMNINEPICNPNLVNAIREIKLENKN